MMSLRKLKILPSHTDNHLKKDSPMPNLTQDQLNIVLQSLQSEIDAYECVNRYDHMTDEERHELSAIKAVHNELTQSLQSRKSNGLSG